MDWVPIVFVTFKLVVFGAGMFFAIKWHHDQGKKRNNAFAGIHSKSGNDPLQEFGLLIPGESLIF